jgi:hypothetical protein
MSARNIRGKKRKFARPFSGSTVTDFSGRLAEARRRRDTASEAEFVALASKHPRPFVEALLKTVDDERPDALMRLPSPWRKRALAAWQKFVALEQSQRTASSVVPFPKERPCK